LRTIQRASANSAERWLADFLGQLQRDDLAPATVCGYRDDLRQFNRTKAELKLHISNGGEAGTALIITGLVHPYSFRFSSI